MRNWRIDLEHWTDRCVQPWINYRLQRPYPPRKNNESIGAYGERLAVIYLNRKGYFIIEHSFRTRSGEIDIVAAWKKRQIVFVEVKSSLVQHENDGGPSDRVHEQKQKKITDVALRFMKQHRLFGTPGRADVIEVILHGPDGKPSFRHFENAFQSIGAFQMLR
jgi:putative endonuclease